ncbi:MAG: archaellum component FlaC, partial [Cryomorphaceae bacterium]
TGIAAASIALGVAGTFGFRNLDDQWKQVNKAQQELKLDQQDVVHDLTDLEEREAAAKQKFQHAELMQQEAVKREAIADRQTSIANDEQKAARASSLKGMEAEQKYVVHLKQANLAQDKAEAAEKNHLTARDAANAEQQQYLKLKTEAAKAKKSFDYASSKAKKAESTAAWYQNKAKKEIAQAECDLAEAIEIKARARSVFHQIHKLKDELECVKRDYTKMDREFDDLERKYDCLKSEKRNIASKMASKIRKLEQQNTGYCRIIESNRSITSQLGKLKCEVRDYKGKWDNQKRETHRHEANVKHKERLISNLKQELSRKK